MKLSRSLLLAASIAACAPAAAAPTSPVKFMLRYQGTCFASGFDYNGNLTDCKGIMANTVLSNGRAIFQFSVKGVPTSLSGPLAGNSMKVDGLSVNGDKKPASGSCTINGDPIKEGLFVCIFHFSDSPRMQIIFKSSGAPSSS